MEEGAKIQSQESGKEHKDHHKKEDNKQAEEEESDCEDCRREREENKLLINMYEKLKHIEGKVEKVQTTLKEHIDEIKHNQSNMSSIGTMLESLNHQSDSNFSAGPVGLQLATELIERRARKKLEQENKRLKQVIAHMHHEQVLKRKTSDAMAPTDLTRIEVTERTVKIEQTATPGSQTTREASVEQTSSQYMVSQSSQLYNKKDYSLSRRQKQKQPVKKNIMPELSLWLFQNQANSQLQNELYSQNNSQRDRTTRNNSYFQKKSGSRFRQGLPTIQQKSDSRRYNDVSLNESRIEQKLPVIVRRK